MIDVELLHTFIDNDFSAFSGLVAVLGVLAGLCVDIATSVLSDALRFAVEDCTPSTCPGSSYNLITAAWANIGYMTHSDFLALLTETKFGAWAPLLYTLGAIGALMSVALNNPPKQWVWFLIGPGIYWFLVDTKQDVRGVAWTIAGQMQPMKEVWKDAETGLANTQLVRRLGVTVNREQGPSGQYPVAAPMVLLDGLFSSSTNRLISWIGVGRQEGTGGADTNLANKEGGQSEGPWYILANLKWGMLENIVGVHARDPDVRDALVTFLASECGDHFKKGVHSANYIAASTARGGTLPKSVLKSEDYDFNFFGLRFRGTDYRKFARGIDTDVIPTPRAIVRLFNQDPRARGSFRQFSSTFKGSETDNPADKKGRTVEIVCSEYLYTIIQALRWEAGHAYWQLVRAAPDGFTRTSLLNSLFYGWDIRKVKGQPYANDTELEDFVKQLIFVYILRNELLYAPQITEAGQRFAPSEQARNFSESYVRTQGSRSKAAELYNWAVMMPHVQGILTYLILIAYPFAAMMMVIPGYWKAAFTWVTFFAWAKLWDVGFAICHALERSVWAMIGNHSAMARVANMLIQTAEETGSVKVGQESDCQGTKISEICAVPDVTETGTLTMGKAWTLLDKALLLTGSADLDLANGYYIYIMSALYFAVPAVTGQLVLGAKAGMTSLVTQGVGQSAGEAGSATKSGTVGEQTNKLSTNQTSLNAGASTKAQRASGLALQQLDNANAASEAELGAGRIGSAKSGFESGATAARLRGDSWGSATKPVKALAGLASNFVPGGAKAGTGSGGDATGGFFMKTAGDAGVLGMESVSDRLTQRQLRAGAFAGGFGAHNDWNAGYLKSAASALSDYGKVLASENDYNEKQAVYEAGNEFASHAAGLGGVAGLNAGSLAPRSKPTEAMGLALSGQLGSRAEGAARFSGFDFGNGAGRLSQAAGIQRYGQGRWGSPYYQANWGSGFSSWDGGFNRAQTMAGIVDAAQTESVWAVSNAGSFMTAMKDKGAETYKYFENLLEPAAPAAPAPTPPSSNKPQ
jgi:hypothetical protein